MNARFNQWGVRRGMLAVFPMVLLGGLLMTGCPLSEYDLGFNDGFAEDDWYYQGYEDSQDTLGYGPILYQGDEIPSPTSPEYERGYWDGVWTAYNDGYFAAYDDAFEEGFMDGYTDANFAGYEGFLLNDVHIEYGTGGYD
ncbi:MAG TPA: hypothetical protein VMZ06_11540, partial [Candidatus Bathyarchaeia archaeon]|nr:hypothetical protein [Candidatus Bathyarchaeia archaeon]